MNSVVLESVQKIFRPGWLFPRVARQDTYALKEISLEVSRGEVLGLLGPNGSGKSTTLKLISTLLLPDRGRVIVNGFDTRSKARAVRRQVGSALAAERSFFPRLTARENLEFFAALEDLPRREVASRVMAVLCDVSLEDSADEHAMKLSSGMYQRLGIARALLKKPSVLLLDEPTRSLDPAAASNFWKLIRHLSNSGITILLATHNFPEAVAVCDRAAILQRGELIAVPRLNDLSIEALRDFYLDATGEQTAPLAWPEEVPA